MNLKALILALAVFAAGQAAFAQTPASLPDPPKGYLIGPGDVLSIKALGEKDFEIETITVDEDGRIQLPYVDDPLMAKCKTERELQAEIAQRWSKFLRNPQLSLRVVERNSRPPVSVYGEVMKQEQFKLTRRVRLLEVLSATGGPSAKNGGKVHLIRPRKPMCGEPDVSEGWRAASETVLGVPVLVLELSDVVKGDDNSNPEVLPGDIVFIPKASPIYVTGEVMKPGEYELPSGGLPLTQAIAMSSGITREAKTKTVKVYRRKPGATQPEVIIANYEAIRKGEEKDIVLQPFDIVEVGKAKKSIGDILLEAAIGLPSRIPIPIRPL